MKPNDRPSGKPFDATESAPDFLAPITPPELFPTAPVQFQPFPKFPTLEEMLEHQKGKPHPLLQLSEVPAPKPSSLFEGLLGGRTEVLLQDALDHPERYDDATRAALEALAARGGVATPEDRKLLDNATLDFAAFRPPRAAPLPVKPKPPAPKPKLLSDEDELRDGRAEPEGGEEAGSPLNGYWWVR